MFQWLDQRGNVFYFKVYRERCFFAETTPIDIAFFDIDMSRMHFFLCYVSAWALTNLRLAYNIIFCIAEDKYIKDVPRIKKSVYLIKSITPKKVQDSLVHLC